MNSSPWAPHPDLKLLGPGAVAPALLQEGAAGRIVAIGTRAICEYLEESVEGQHLLPLHPSQRAEARRLWAWVEEGFEEVTDSC